MKNYILNEICTVPVLGEILRTVSSPIIPIINLCLGYVGTFCHPEAFSSHGQLANLEK